MPPPRRNSGRAQADEERTGAEICFHDAGRSSGVRLAAMSDRAHRRVSSAAAVLCLLASAAVVGACGGAGERSPGDAGEVGERRFLSIGTAPPGGAFFVIGGTLAEVLNSHSGRDNWRFTAEATKGSKENIRRLAAGELDLALSNAAITYFAVRGEAGWSEPAPVRAVMTLAPNVGMFLAPSDSEILTLADLAGKRVVVGPAGAGFEEFLRPVLSAHGVEFADFTPLNATQAGAVGMLGDGSVDAVFLGGVVPTSSVTQATTSQEISFVPYDEAVLDRLVDEYPFYRRTTLAEGTYPNMEGDFEALVVGALHLITSAAANEEMVYTIAKTLYESKAQVIERHGVGRAITAENAPNDTGTPFHPGAERFYREIGVWPQDAASD